MHVENNVKGNGRVVATTQSFKYQYKYQYLSLKYQYQHQYPCLKYKYKYQYFSSKYQYQYKYLKMVLKYRSSTSTSTQYYNPGQWCTPSFVPGGRQPLHDGNARAYNTT